MKLDTRRRQKKLFMPRTNCLDKHQWEGKDEFEAKQCGIAVSSGRAGKN